MAKTVLAAACTVLACASVTASPARAGSYVVHGCSPETSPGVWTHVNTGPAGFASGNLCGGPEIGPLDGGAHGSLYAEDVIASPTTVPNGARAGWTVTAPAGATITAISYYRTLASHNDRDSAAGLFQADGRVLEQCRIALPFGSSSVCSMPNNQVPVVFPNLNTTSLFFGVICDIVVDPEVTASCIGGGTIHDVQAYMYSANVTVAENAAPTVTGIGGALWGGSLVSGTAPVTFSALDASGIREQAVQSDAGRIVISRPQACDYTRQPPCPQTPDAALNADTTRVADGTHTFRLVVTDTAGNSTVVNSPPVVVDNNGPPPPLGLIATARAGSDTIALSWTNPPSPPAPVTGAIAQVCGASCTTPVSIDASGNVQVPASGPGVYVVRVWLLDAAGRGGPHNAAVATVTVPSSASAQPPPPPLSGARTRIAAVLHGRQLRVSGPITGSGRVSVSWRSKVRGRTVGHGSRTVTIRASRLRMTFAIPRRARVQAATIRVVVRRGGRVVGQARARRT